VRKTTFLIFQSKNHRTGQKEEEEGVNIPQDPINPTNGEDKTASRKAGQQWLPKLQH
jgi:hypothetical protein